MGSDVMGQGYKQPLPADSLEDSFGSFGSAQLALFLKIKIFDAF